MLFIVKYLHKISGIKKHIGWLLADLIVVFVGVYAAFMLNEYKETRQNQQRKQQIITALIESLEEDEKVFTAVLKLWEEQGKPLLELYEQGKLPEIMPQLSTRVEVYVSDNAASWGAIFQLSVEILDVEVIKEMEKLQELNMAVVEVVNRFLRLVDSVIIPNADKDFSEFYDPQTKKLRRKYEWFVFLTQSFVRRIEQVHKQTVDVKEMLSARKDAHKRN